MNAIIYAINEINQQIPIEMLTVGLTFGDNPAITNLSTLDDKIKRKVLVNRVLKDCNVVGGIEMIIPLYQIQPSQYEFSYTVYNVPPEAVMNREIISALSLSLIPTAGYLGFEAGYAPNNSNMNNSVLSVADRIGNSASSGGVLSNAHIEIVAYNTLLVYANYRTLSNFGVRVILENDKDMNNIQIRSYKSFSMLCVLAVKAYIYNKLVIAINNGYLSGGQDLGMFKNVLDSYSDSEEQYRTYLREVWGGIAFMNDNTRYNKHLRSMIAPDL